MSTLYLILTWVLLGIVIGALALAARFKPSAWRDYGWLRVLALGLGSALLGGLLGFWLLGRLFSAASALWIAVLATCAPWIYTSLRSRFARNR